MIKFYKPTFLVFVILLVTALVAQGQTKRFVDVGAASGANDGSSWENAYMDLHMAIAGSQDGDSIFVRKGVYTLTNPVTMKNGVKIYGSFAGTESSLSQRVFGSTTADSTVLDGAGSLQTIIFNNAAGAPMGRDAVLDGFVITGAAFYNKGAFVYDGGAAILLRFASPTLQNLIIRKNFSNLDGAGIYMEEYSSPSLTNVIISGNRAKRHAGAIFMRVESRPVLTNVLMSGNCASGGFGGAMMIDSRYNIADVGSKPIFTNVTITGNYSKNDGGGVYVRGSNTIPQFRNSIILNNTSDKGASQSGVSYKADSKAANEAAQPYNYCLIQGADLTGDPIYASGTNISSNGVTAEQVFVDPVAATLNDSTVRGNFRLKSGNNPAINAGHSPYYDGSQNLDLTHIKTDLAGEARIAKASVDLGAYEFQNQLPVASEVGFSGNLVVESKLSGSFEWDDDDAGDMESMSIYAWYRADDASGTNAVAITGATSIDYVLQAEDQDKYVAFEVKPGDGEGHGSPVRSAFAKVEAKNIPPTAKNVSITGTLKAGETLSGIYDWEDSDAGDTDMGSTYAWYRADDETGLGMVAIENATIKEYVVQEADQGKYIAFEVTPKDGEDFGTAARSAWTKINEPVAGNTPPTASDVSITGALEVGQTLTGTYTWKDEDAGDTNTGSTYSWFRSDNNGAANVAQINDAIGAEYIPQAGDRGKYIRFEVVPNDGKSYGAASKSDWFGPILDKAVIMFAAKGDKTYGDADFTAGASSNSDAAILYHSDNTNVATIDGTGMIHLVGFHHNFKKIEIIHSPSKRSMF